MELDSAMALKEQQQRQNTFVQVLNIEKQLLASIHTKGLLHKDVQELYHQVRDGYESVILNDHDAMELQEVEHLLWKLHYKHIDEFRRSIRPRPSSGEVIKGEAPRVGAETSRNINRHVEAFKSFLSEAAEFYQNLIRKFREICGLPGELFIHKNRASLKSVETMKLNKCRFTCHRFLICLGDIARYGELFKKQADSKWLVAFTCYVEASRICPASGNPHNQLTLLATYVNDSFLALYHCTRSLAVEEPFPDAWNNLMLLFEESKSFQVTSLSNGEQLDFLKPYEKISLHLASQSADDSSDNSNLESANGLSDTSSALWPLFVRLTSFFLRRSSLEEFPGVVSSIVKHMEAFVQLDDEQLMSALNSYKLIDSSRRGPFRALQLVSVFIFILHTLSREPQWVKLNGDHQEQESSLTQLALVATFICIARLVERCVQGNQLENCPLLPAVMVFVEWLEGTLDTLEAHATDEKVICAISYFFSVLTDLLNRLGISEAALASDESALWEDHELRGFEPILPAHISLNFTTHWEWTENLNSKRSQRLFQSGMRIANQSNYSRPWISFDRKGMKFYTKEHHEENHRKAQVEEKNSCGERQNQGSSPAPTEEEEIILFKPIIRHNSAPLCKYIKNEDQLRIRELKEPSKSADESLRRATSMFLGQNQPPSDRLGVPSDTSSLRYSKPLKQQDALPTFAAGPPSLNAWVFDRENANYELQPGFKNFNKHDLSPIQEVAVESLASLLIDDTNDSASDAVRVTTNTQNAPPAYVAPVPSAPLLPDDATWFRGNSSGFVDYNSTVGSREADGILGAAPTSLYPSVSAPHGPLDFSPVLPGLVHGYPPVMGMSSSEWLYHYRNSHKLEQANNHIWPVNVNGPGPPLSYHASDISRFDLFNQWGQPVGSASAFYMESPPLHPVSPLVYGADERRTDNLLNYPRPSPYICGAVTDTRAEQPPLLQYLKEKEWQLHSPQRSPTFLGN
ncbi:OLC1v1021496C1 [Oldenlandia corymbosa var. corymbosa]|uniref:OLC1v1021496C1 n=1 Tax=Oldenlandia corymbosa var. corymbosa TaxID=529605 RepID=A0AAV1BYB6_OLDCO|nr:OLC1v1021496C1 [Oldenlandia corymbosa var. corymbosa]